MLRRLLILCLLLAPASSDAATTIHVLGSFNGWQPSVFEEPGMTFDGSVWRDTVSIGGDEVDRGYQQFKLVTDGNWDVPPDYVLCPDRLDEYGRLSGPVCPIAYGLNLQMYADVAGRYEMRLDETALTYTATLVRAFDGRITGHVSFPGAAASTQAAPTAMIYVSDEHAFVLARSRSDETTGAFEVGRLETGRPYSVAVVAPGFAEVQFANVVIPDGGSVDLGGITMLRDCSTQYSSIQVVGDFNAWDTTVPSMTFADCVWRDTLVVVSGCHYMKFRTNGDWGDDFGTCSVQDPTCSTPLSGSTCVGNGESALGQISIPSTDLYVFRLDEFLGTYEIVPLVTPTRRVSWGRLKTRYR
jgi:hypothetical protein